jgi:dihydroorotate dehydrogenase
VLYDLARPLLFRLPPELAHEAAMLALRAVQASPDALRALRDRMPTDPALRTRALGLDFPSPIGLAAGFDKDALAPDALAALGFGFVEVGTVTARPQPGNPRPRLFRLPADRALVNRMGFNNHGAAAAAARLRRRSGAIVGVNIGKSKAASESEAEDDYATSARAIAAVADYVVVNVSSPNTPGLRDLQATEKLRPILRRVRAELDAALAASGREAPRVPLLVKIAPDLSDEDIDDVARLALDLKLDGIIATNTTIARTGLTSPAAQVEECGAGGLSGAPLKQRSLEVLRRLKRATGDKLTLVAVGGVETAQDVQERLDAGATLVQGYTAFLYEGPFWAARINRQLAKNRRS